MSNQIGPNQALHLRPLPLFRARALTRSVSDLHLFLRIRMRTSADFVFAGPGRAKAATPRLGPAPPSERLSLMT
jgi:hypothetical protein